MVRGTKLNLYLIFCIIVSINFSYNSFAWNGDEGPFGRISREEITTIANEMMNSTWSPNKDFTNYEYGNTYHTYRASKTYTGEAYSQGSTQESWNEFINKVSNTKGGDQQYGNDCSGFVSMCWRLLNRYSTHSTQFYGFGNTSRLNGEYFYALGETGRSESVSLLKGDALNAPGNHIVLLKEYYDSGIKTMEQTPHTAQEDLEKTWSYLRANFYKPLRRNLIEDSHKIGDTVKVTCDDVNVRICAGTNCQSDVQKAQGIIGVIVGGPEDVDTYRWWKVKYYDDNRIGWTNEGYLKKIPMKAQLEGNSEIFIEGKYFGTPAGTITVKPYEPDMSIAPIVIANPSFWEDTEVRFNLSHDPTRLTFESFDEPILIELFRNESQWGNNLYLPFDGEEIGKLYFPFKDVEPGIWYSKDVVALWKAKVTHGKGDTDLYAPADNINFAEFIKMIVIASPELNENQCQGGDLPFPIDVSTIDFPPFSTESGPWYCPYYKNSSIQEWITVLRGLDSSRGWPGQKIKRKEVALFLAKAKGVNNTISVKFFPDVDINNPFANYINACNLYGIFKGYPEEIDCNNEPNNTGERYFCPEKNINRAEVARVINNAFLQ
ncbi:S-layer homology domain-containing protein [Desulfococcaceae bacterium HSG7]|nr:S-layer homology domain-containing protein [Desulfococcaceae bacterium HSG7]